MCNVWCLIQFYIDEYCSFFNVCRTYVGIRENHNLNIIYIPLLYIEAIDVKLHPRGKVTCVDLSHFKNDKNVSLIFWF